MNVKARKISQLHENNRLLVGDVGFLNDEGFRFRYSEAPSVPFHKCLFSGLRQYVVELYHLNAWTLIENAITWILRWLRLVEINLLQVNSMIRRHFNLEMMINVPKVFHFQSDHYKCFPWRWPTYFSNT